MNIWFTADTHFAHPKIIEFCQKTRPCKPEDMDDVLIDKWNSVVKDEDIIYVLGDFCWNKNADQYINRLSGNIKFIPGNHDIWMTKQNLKKQNFTKTNFEILPHYVETRFDKTKFVLCHYPIVQWNRMQYGSIHLYGHMHGALALDGKAMDVGIDTRKKCDMLPYHIDEIWAIMKDKPVLQHHLIVKNQNEHH